MVHTRWLSRRALGLHLTLAVVVPGFLALTAWQVDRAVTGNTLSWVYSFEWPFFAGYAVFMWWRLIHEDGAPFASEGAEGGADDAAPEPRRAMVGGLSHTPARAPAGTGHADATAASQPPQPDDELEAYNRYLAALNESGTRKRW